MRLEWLQRARAGPCVASASSLPPFLPVVRMPAQMLHRSDYDGLRFDRVMDAVRKPAYQITSQVGLDDASANRKFISARWREPDAKPPRHQRASSVLPAPHTV